MTKIKNELQNYRVCLDTYISVDAAAETLSLHNFSHHVSLLATKEMKATRDYFVHLIRNYTDEESLNLAIRRFFRIRWAAIRQTPLAYVECLFHPLNSLCEQLAIDIAEPGESIAAILMPTIQVKYYATIGESLIALTEHSNRTLATHRFIISHDCKSIIPVQEWVELQDGKANEPYLYHPYLTGPQGEHDLIAPEAYESDYVAYYQQFTRTLLSPEDLESLKTVSPSLWVYIGEIQSRLQKINTRGSLSEAVTKLCNDCLANGVSSKKRDINGDATDANPHPDVYPLIREFLNTSWAAVCDEDKKIISTLSSGEYSFADYLLVLRAGAGDNLTPMEEAKRRRDRLHTCVEVNGHAIRRILNAHLNVFAGIKTETTPLQELLHAVRVNHPSKPSSDTERYKNGEEILQLNLTAYEDCLHNKPIDNDVNKLRLYYYSRLTDEFIGSLDKSMALKWAAENKMLPLVVDLIESGADLRKKVTRFGSTIFHWAAEHDYDPIIELCLNKNIDPNIQANGGWTALHYLAKEGNAKMMKLLLEKGANVNHPKSDGWTVLHLAVHNGQKDCVDLLLARSGIEKSLNHKNNDGKTPLYLASDKNNIPLILCLIKRGANLTYRVNESGKTILHRAVFTEDWDAVFTACLEANSGLNTQENQGWAAIHYLARDGKTELMARLIHQGADINLRKKDGLTALHLAVMNKQKDSVDLLLEHKEIHQSLNHKSLDGKTPLDLAWECDNLLLMKSLIKKGAHFRDGVGDLRTSLLKWAVDKRQLEFALLLVNSGADLTERINADADTIFSRAAENGWNDIFYACLKNGVDCNATANARWTALHLVARNGNADYLKSLLLKGANVNDFKFDGWTALHLAVLNKHYDCVSLLLAHKDIELSVNHKNQEGKKPLDLAVAMNDYRLVSLFASESDQGKYAPLRPIRPSNPN